MDDSELTQEHELAIRLKVEGKDQVAELQGAGMLLISR
jgi:hypothetical protein